VTLFYLAPFTPPYKYLLDSASDLPSHCKLCRTRGQHCLRFLDCRSLSTPLSLPIASKSSLTMSPAAKISVLASLFMVNTERDEVFQIPFLFLFFSVFFRCPPGISCSSTCNGSRFFRFYSFCFFIFPPCRT